MAQYLADTSAWHWSGRVADRWEALLDDDEIAVCTPVVLELLYSARSRADYRTLGADFSALPHVPLSARADAIARRTQAALAERSQHRDVTPIDVLVGAMAESAGLTLLHYDRHFDAIARVTGQATEWIARRGTLA